MQASWISGSKIKFKWSAFFHLKNAKKRKKILCNTAARIDHPQNYFSLQGPQITWIQLFDSWPELERLERVCGLNWTWRGSNYLSGLILKSYCLYITHLMDELKLLTPWCCFFKCLHLPSYHHQSCDNRRGVFFWVALFSGCEIWPLPTPWKIDDPRGNVHIVIQCTITVIFFKFNL